MHPLPQTGVLTFVFTDIEGSTSRWDRAPDAMANALATHDVIVSETLQAHGGSIFKRLGDGFCCVFAVPARAAEAAVEVQRKLASQAWDRAVGELRIRIGLHTGNALAADDDYFGPALNRAARLMACGYGGQILLSSATAALVSGELPPGIDCVNLGTHRLRDLAEPETIFQLCAPELQRDFPPPRTLDFRPNNLPLELSSFVGRDAELAELHDLILRARLVTIAGPGGIGKTRLALHAASDLLDDFHDGVWFVRLAPTSDANLIPQAIAAALGISEAAAEPIESTLIREIAHKRMLLVLDNAEHLLPALSERVRTLAEAANDLHVLVTSRQPLHRSGEQVYRLGPIDSAAASRLFIERAQAAVHDFKPESGDAEDLAAIAQTLQGIPLAIELSAGRLTTLPLHQIRERLGAQLAFLQSSSSEDNRHRTLRETTAWSYDLLGTDERTLLERLAVFVDGFTLEACENIASGLPVLDVLEALVDKSFLVVDRSMARYRMLEVIREFACERAEADLLDAARRDHFDFFAAFARQGKRSLPHGELGDWLNRMDAEVANIRAALEYGFATARPELGEMLTGLFRFWYIRRTVKEARIWFQRYVENAVDTSPDLPSVLRRASAFASIEGDYAEADVLAKRALTLYHASHDEAGVLEALHALAVNETRRGNYAGAERLYGDIASRCNDSGQERAAVTSDANRASIRLKSGDIEGAERLLTECSRRAERLGDDDVFATVVALQGTLAFKRGEFERADDLFRRSLAMKKELKSEFGIAEVSAALAVVCARLDRLAEATAFACDSLKIALDLAEARLIVSALETCALVALQSDAYETARDALSLAQAERRMHSVRERVTLGAEELEPELKRRFGSSFEVPQPPDWKSAALAIESRMRSGSVVSLS
jgi:predicted ATPase/class 3 adenylate cyclase